MTALPARDHVVADPIKELFSANARLADANKIMAEQIRVIATLTATLRNILKAAEDDTEYFHECTACQYARAALAEIDGRAPANAVQVEG